MCSTSGFWGHFPCFFSSFFILTVTSSSLVYTVIHTFRDSRYLLISSIFCCATIIVWVLLLWCWFYTCSSDPGYLSAYYEERGILDRLLHGDIPDEYINWEFCGYCSLPRPHYTMHCDVCGKCVMRYDHHCDIIGKCVGDKNFKSFCMFFLYFFIFGFFVTITNIVSSIYDGRIHITSNHFGYLCSVYCMLFGLLMLYIFISFFTGGIWNISTSNCSNLELYRILLNSFGETLIQKLIPTQKNFTELAVQFRATWT